ncbi:MAG: ATP-binding protein [Raineya sp.]|nr:ATP-binding protein [Raineya sp.]MDW8296012.1 ATP-binding protein [Raineya sp.]
MLIDFSVENFASIKERQTLSLIAENSTKLQEYYLIKPLREIRLLKMACILGANASGKTNILDALTFLRIITNSMRATKDQKLPFTPFLFSEKTSEQNTNLQVRFVAQNNIFHYQLTLNNKCVLFEKLLLNENLIFERISNSQTKFVEIRFGKQIQISKNLKEHFQNTTLWNNTVLATSKTINHDIHLLKIPSEWFSNNFFPLASHRYKTKSNIFEFLNKNLYEKNLNIQNILAILQKADLNISAIELEKKLDDKGFNLNFLHKVGNTNYYLPFAKQSRGTQFYYILAGILELMLESSIVVCIDELEKSIHPDLLEHFLIFFLKNIPDSQLIFTTHHRELLLEQDMLRKDVIWFTEKQPNGATELFSLADFAEITEKTSWYKAYKTGKIGAKPFLKDTYLGKYE